MKSLKITLALALAASLIIPVSCDKDDPDGPDGPGQGTNIVYVEEDVTAVTTWYSDSVYVIKNYDMYVLNTLTIQPGTVIKFHGDGPDISLGSGGTIVAIGTSEAPIIFTSWKDDSAGGDTNGDGTASSPSVKDWGAISTNSENGSRFEYCEFRYGGSSSYSSSLVVYGNNIKVNNCVFAHNSGDDHSGWYGALDASYAGPDCEIRSNTFFDNVRPMSVGTAISIDNTNVFHNPEEPAVENTYNAIFIESTDDITRAISWLETEVPFVIDDNDLWIYSGGSLTLANQVVIKFRPGSAIVLDGGEGDIINHDGVGVYFTSYKDDDYKGDTNADGTATLPSAGDWLGIYDNVYSDYVGWANVLYTGAN